MIQNINSSFQTDQRMKVRGGIYIQIPQTGYESGDLIQGVLNIFLEENYAGHILQLSLEGTEQTYYIYTKPEYTEGGIIHPPQLITANGYNKFIDFKIPVYDFAQAAQSGSILLQPGQWKIPFELKISEKLPSSYRYSAEYSPTCSLRYILRATILPLGTYLQPLQGEQEISVVQKFQIVNPEVLIITEYEFAPNTCCCCGAQPFKMQAYTNQTCYYPGENVFLSYSTNLSTQTIVRTFKIEIKGSLVLKTHKDHQKLKTKIYESEVKIPLDKEAKDSGNVKETVNFIMPPNIHPSVDGSLIKLKYYIKISPKIDSSCCVCDDNISNFVLKIKVGPSNVSSFNMPPQNQIPLTQFQFPQNWNPNVLQQIVFSPQQAEIIQKQQAQFSQSNSNKYDNQDTSLMGINSNLLPPSMPNVQMFINHHHPKN